jgi:hypothetical protein
MTPSELAPAHPYRVTRRTDLSGRPLKGPQHRVLEALVELCPEPGRDATSRVVAELAGQRVGPAVGVLKSLEKLRFVMRLDFGEGQAVTWTPTLTGRNRVG